MFLSKDDLKLAYGVDLDIGSSYVNRNVPDANLYWHQRKVYIPESPGYYFMPIFSDLLFRHGISKNDLLKNDTFIVAESILHAAAQLEYQKLTWKEHISQIKLAIQPYILNDSLFDEIQAYLDVADRPQCQGRLGTTFPSLNRADSYLFVLACLPQQGFDVDGAIKSWYGLMTYFLILDDLVDIKDDLKNREENTFIEAGFDELGIKRIEQMITASHDVLLHVNPVLANRIDHKRKTMDLTQLIRSILSE